MPLLPDRYRNYGEIYAALLFLVFVLAPLPHLNLWQGIASVASVLVFVVLYFKVHWTEGRTALPYLAAMIALGLLIMPFNFGASAYFIYASALAALSFEFAVALLIATIIMVGYLATNYISGHFNIYVIAVFIVGIVLNILYAQVRKSTLVYESLGQREEEIGEFARQAERQRIGQDLHDQLGQAFALISIKAELIRKLLPGDHERANRELAELAQTARQGLQSMRETVHGYQHSLLEEELQSARDLLRSAGTSLSVRQESETAFGAVEDGLLALILRESVTNIVRHARATRCEISIVDEAGNTILQVRDNGRGSRNYQGSGIRSMKDRASRMGARFTITRDNGTIVRVVKPGAER